MRTEKPTHIASTVTLFLPYLRRMCGIVGAFNFRAGTITSEHIGEAVNRLACRGPDEQRTYAAGSVLFGHTRLRILDLSPAGSQPMSDPSGRYTIIYNGEVYNFREIRAELEKRGEHFQSQTDTEVVLRSFIAWGEAALNRFNGFFAFAIHDKEKDELFLARDRFGIKPLLFATGGDVTLSPSSGSGQALSRGASASMVRQAHHDSTAPRQRSEAMDSPFGGEGGWFAFASELKALLSLPISRDLDHVSLLQYLHLNYIPGPHSVFTNVKKLLPGHCIRVNSKGVEVRQWYELSPGNVTLAGPLDGDTTRSGVLNSPPAKEGSPEAGVVSSAPFKGGVVPTSRYRGGYESQKDQLSGLLEASVKRRLIADVPLGAFLSGGIDSSVIVALASKHTSKLKTFSIGFPDNPYFDETEYANAVAEKYGTDHTVFHVTGSDLLANLEATLDYIDEPFADSSALLVKMLSKETRRHVTVALSGDGGDELFAGYRKHRAEFLIRRGGLKVSLVKALSPLWKMLPKSRESAFANKIRQLERFAEAAKLGPQERYWRLCGYTSGDQALDLLAVTAEQAQLLSTQVKHRREKITALLDNDDSLNAVLLTDLGFILPNDMLHKVDLMSMAHGLEVRVPFLDHTVVEFATRLPAEAKITSSQQKRIVKDAFAHLLPPQLLSRPKQGFEVPLLHWLRKDLKPMLDDLLDPSFLEKQGLFSPPAVGQLRRQLLSRNPGDAASRTYGLLVFQYWWRRNLS